MSRQKKYNMIMNVLEIVESEDKEETLMAWKGIAQRKEEARALHQEQTCHGYHP